MLLSSMVPQSKVTRLIIVFLGFSAIMYATYFFLAPRGGKYSTDLKFMHCKSCNVERRYDARGIDQKCLGCSSKKKDGTYVATRESVKDSAGSGSPWRWFSVASSFEFVVLLFLVYFVLRFSPSGQSLRYLYFNCPKCKWRLKYKDSSAGKPGQCPRCRRVFSFPEREETQKKAASIIVEQQIEQ